MVPNALKKCSSCKEDKTLDNFYKASAAKDGLYPRCKYCDKIARQQWEIRNPERSAKSKRKRRLKYIYNLTQDDYDLLLHQQQNGCALCKKDNKGWFLAVDHCHKTGKVRGLLCNLCNRAIGMLNDDPELIKRAANYLESH